MTTKHEWRRVFDLAVAARLARLCEDLLRDHTDPDVCSARATFGEIATDLEMAFEAMPEDKRALVDAEVSRHFVNVHL